MSESPAYVPPFVRMTADSTMPPDTAQAASDDLDSDLDDDGDIVVEHDVENDDDVDADLSAAPASRAREGLPPSYRMRAEPHYVEALVDRSLAAFDPAPAAPVAPQATAAVTPSVAPVTAVAADAPALPASMSVAAMTLADAFDAIQAALRDVPLRGRPLRDRVAIELARAEAARGRWLADAAVVLQVEPLPALDEIDLLRLLGEVFEAFGPENRLSGGVAAMQVPQGRCPVFGDERLLTTALGAILAAVRALIEDRGDARRVSVALGPRREVATRTIEVCQTAVRLPASAYPRFFEADWADHPAGPAGALLLAAARKIARAHGGGLEVTPLDGGGSRLVLSVPAAD